VKNPPDCDDPAGFLCVNAAALPTIPVENPVNQPFRADFCVILG